MIGEQPTDTDGSNNVEVKVETPDRASAKSSTGKGIVSYSSRGRPRRSARPDYMVLNVRGKHQQAEQANNDSTVRVRDTLH